MKLILYNESKPEMKHLSHMKNHDLIINVICVIGYRVNLLCEKSDMEKPSLSIIFRATNEENTNEFLQSS